MAKNFDPSLIEIRLNPFSSTRSSSISEGVFMKDLTDNEEYILNSDTEIDIKILTQLKQRLFEIESGKAPQHILILGEYGQGKSFSLKTIQDDIFKQYNGAIISIPIGVNFQSADLIPNKLIEDIEHLFDHLDITLYTNKEAVSTKYSLLTKPKTFHQSLEAYDKAFKELNILVYLFIDELDKIVISDLHDDNIKLFLENLKLIGDTCSRSISLFIAGTPNCLLKMDLLSIDYGQRFDKIECNFLTPEETLDYIKKKCFVKLKQARLHPFDIQVKKQIHLMADGNIRKIEVVCRDLWNYSARRKQKINILNLNIFLSQKLLEPVKNELGTATTDTIVNFILTLFISGGKKSVIYFRNNLSLKKQKEIASFLTHSNNVKKVGFNYLLDQELFKVISDKLFS